MYQTSFNFFSAVNDALANYKGDVHSSSVCKLWVVEHKTHAGWRVGTIGASHTREGARDWARKVRAIGVEVRVVPYKACIDTKGRHNRQVVSERLDA